MTKRGFIEIEWDGKKLKRISGIRKWWRGVILPIKVFWKVLKEHWDKNRNEEDTG